MALFKPTVVALSLALAFSLSACGSSQTAEQACELVKSELQTATERMSEADSSDPDSAAAAIETLSDDLDDIHGQVGNKEVKDAFGELADIYDELATAYSDMIETEDLDNPGVFDTEEIADISTRMQEADDNFIELCGPIS